MSPDHREQNWLNRLQASGYRLTSARIAVVQVMSKGKRALLPMDAFLEARKLCSSLGLVTVYRTLEKLEELGCVVRVHSPNGCGAYLAAAEGHEHLIICTRCQKAEYFKGDDLHPLMERVAKERGYSVQDHWLQLFGLCSDCLEQA